MPAVCETSQLAAQHIVLPRRPLAILCLLTLLLAMTILFNSHRLNKPMNAVWYRPLARFRTVAPAAVAAQLPSAARAMPVRHVYFLKTHKCASTTVQRIILTHAIRNNLSIALPTKSIHSFYPEAFSPSVAKHTCTDPGFDVMASHALFSESAREAMPVDTVYVGIVRDPADQMESAYYFYLIGYCSDFQHKELAFSQYLSLAIQQYGSSNSSDDPSPMLSSIQYGCNIQQLRFLQLHDFGFDLSESPTPQRVQAAIRRLDTLFDIVLVVERLEEGLILLRDRLGWSTADMFYLRNNFRVNWDKPEGTVDVMTEGDTATTSLSNATRQAAYEWNWGDKMLYDHFRAKMDMAIEQNAVYLRKQVKDFRRREAEFYNRCVVGVMPGEQRPASNSVWTEHYVLNNGSGTSDECRLAVMGERDLFAFINNQQLKCKKSRSIANRHKALLQGTAIGRLVMLTFPLLPPWISH